MSSGTAYAPLDPSVSPVRRGTADDLVVGIALTVGLAVLGVLVGLLWVAWAPQRPAAEVLGGGRFIPDETEAFIAGDGRFLVLTAAVGLVAALGIWFGRPANRGVPVAAGLVAGGLAGAALTELVGHLAGGGSAVGRVVTDSTGQQFRLTAHLPLSLHMAGLVVIEATVASLVYGLLAAFTASDDLSRADPVRDRLRGAAPPTGGPGFPAGASPSPYGRSVDAGGHAQHGGGDGDAASPAQQRDLPPQ